MIRMYELILNGSSLYHETEVTLRAPYIYMRLSFPGRKNVGFIIELQVRQGFNQEKSMRGQAINKTMGT